jgi:SAM-dependent methyltransferase
MEVIDSASLESPVFDLDRLVPFLRASGYNEPWHESRLVETARRIPRATEGRAVYVDVGTHPLVFHGMVRIGGYRRAFGLNWNPGSSAPYQDVVVKEEQPAADSFRYRIFNANLEWDRLPFEDGSIDLITCLEVIEHVTSDPMHLLIELNRIMRPGGTLIMSTPNAVSWRAAIQMALKQHPMNYPYFFPGHYTNRHNIEFTPSQITSLMTSAGFLGEIATFDAWVQPTRWQRLRLRFGGFHNGDRGDCIMAVVKKAGPPAVRYDPTVYLLSEEQLRENHEVALTYRSG